MTQANFQNHFGAHATGYALHRPTYPPSLIHALTQMCVQRRTAWDAGCGSGQLSNLLAHEFEQVIATDGSAEQIAQATQAQNGQSSKGQNSNVRYAVIGAEDAADLPELMPASVDLCVAAQAAHWFDMPKYNQVVRRVGKPGSVVALVTYNMMQTEAVSVDQAIRNFYYGELAPFWPPQRRHVEDNYARLAFDFEPITMPALQIERDWNVAAMIGYIRTWSAINAMRQAGLDERIAAFEAQLTCAWGEAQRTQRVTWPLAVIAGRV